MRRRFNEKEQSCEQKRYIQEMIPEHKHRLLYMSFPTFLSIILFQALLIFPIINTLAQSHERIPLIYCTDLFHPHQDPDDHLDLMTLFSMSEFDVKAILLDQGNKQEKTPGSIPVRQMLTLTGKNVPYAIGLASRLKSETDTGEDQDSRYQGAVNLFLKTLRETPVPVQVIVVGSLRDVVAAFNRNPELVKSRVSMFHINAGRAAIGRGEWNVHLDPKAYKRLLESGLPISLYPCLPLDNKYSSHWLLKHYGDVLETAPLPLQNLFIYALSRIDTTEIDPQKALKMNLRPWRRLIWPKEKNMWCLASFINTAGRKIYRFGDEWKALPEQSGEQNEDTIFTMVPARIEVEAKRGFTTVLDYNSPNPNVLTIVQEKPEDYQNAMNSCLKYILQEFQVNMSESKSIHKKRENNK